MHRSRRRLLFVLEEVCRNLQRRPDGLSYT
jgi:hypothetical protein